MQYTVIKYFLLVQKHGQIKGSQMRRFIKDKAFVSMISDMTFDCEFCGENFSSIAERRSFHKKSMKDCEKMYIWQSQLSKRMSRRSHPNGKKIRKEEIKPVTKKNEKIDNLLSRKSNCCVLCGKIFSNESKLNIHKEKNHGKFTCSDCKLSYAAEELLTNHINKRHKTFPCPDCKTMFTRKASLKLHMEVHQKKFEICTECDKRFSSKANLQRHIRNIHGGGKEQTEEQLKVKCEPDNDNTADAAKETEPENDLKVAVSMHHKTCTECDNTFASKDSLRRHMRNIHGNGKNDKDKQFKGKSEPDNDNNTDMAKETKPSADEMNSLSTFNPSYGQPMDICKELEEFPLLEFDDMEEIFAEFGFTTAEMFEQVFREEESYFAISQQAFQKIDLTPTVSQN